MLVDDIEGRFRRLMEEGFSQGRLEVLEELFAPDTIEHQVRGRGPETQGVEGAKKVVSSLRTAFPDLRYTIEDLVVDGDKVWARMKAHGTNKGMFQGQPPTGRTIDIDVIDVVRFRDGRIVEHWGVPDRLGAMMQLGTFAPPQTR